MKVSVVIPTYQRPTLLRRCLHALSEQTLHPNDFEIVVVSDGPDVATLRMVKLFRKTRPHINLRFFNRTKRSGPAATRNFGWKKASANLIAFTDDDCIPDKGWLEAVVNAYLKSSNDMVAFSGNTVVPISHPPTDYEQNIAHLEQAEFITANCACTKTILESVQGFDERFKLAWREDSDLHFKLIANGVSIVSIDATVVHPVRKHHWTDCFKDERKGIFNALLYKKYPTLYRAKIQKHGPVSYYFIAAALLVALCGLLTAVPLLFWIGFLSWITITTMFIIRRLQNTSLAIPHVVEMVVTSLIIPPISLYWRWYGALKYRVWNP